MDELFQGRFCCIQRWIRTCGGDWEASIDFCDKFQSLARINGAYDGYGYTHEVKKMIIFIKTLVQIMHQVYNSRTNILGVSNEHSASERSRDLGLTHYRHRAEVTTI